MLLVDELLILAIMCALIEDLGAYRYLMAWVHGLEQPLICLLLGEVLVIEVYHYGVLVLEHLVGDLGGRLLLSPLLAHVFNEPCRALQAHIKIWLLHLNLGVLLSGTYQSDLLVDS